MIQTQKAATSSLHRVRTRPPGGRPGDNWVAARETRHVAATLRRFGETSPPDRAAVVPALRELLVVVAGHSSRRTSARRGAGRSFGSL